jgi:DNA-binding NarL/FixJ family response regulator
MRSLIRELLEASGEFDVVAEAATGYRAIRLLHEARPELVTLDELEGEVAPLAQIGVETVVNGRLHRRNVVENMTFPPAHLVSFLSHVMPLESGDVLATGTPGAAVISDGDEVTCRVDGVGEDGRQGPADHPADELVGGERALRPERHHGRRITLDEREHGRDGLG